MTEVTHLFHQREKRTEDQLPFVMDRAARQCSMQVYFLYLPGRRGQIQRGRWETVHEASRYH